MKPLVFGDPESIARLLMLFGGHALADYPLQGDFLARAKNHRAPIPGVPWYQALLAHAAIQGLFVGLIMGSVGYGLAEMMAHALIDYAKCDNRISFNTDQVLHLICKCVWVGCAVIVQ